MMSEAQRGGRRHSARLADKEDPPFVNGTDYEPAKQQQKSIVNAKGGKGAGVAKTGTKRKPGELPFMLVFETASTSAMICGYRREYGS